MLSQTIPTFVISQQISATYQGHKELRVLDCCAQVHRPFGAQKLQQGITRGLMDDANDYIRSVSMTVAGCVLNCLWSPAARRVYG